MTIFIESEQLQQIKAYKPLVHNYEGQQKVKLALMQGIKDFFADKFYRLKEATRKAIDYIAWLSSDRGFIFASQLHIGGKYGVSDRTIRSIMRELEGAGLIVKAYRRASNTNAKGKPVYFFTKHKYFTYWKELLFQEDFQEENKQTPYESKTEEVKKSPTIHYLTKLRDLINNKQVLSNDQNKALQIIKNQKRILPQWIDHAEVVASALPKKMSATHWKAFYEVVGQVMTSYEAKYGNPMKYFETSFKNAVKKAEAKERLEAFSNGYDWLNGSSNMESSSAFSGVKKKGRILWYNWLEE